MDVRLVVQRGRTNQQAWQLHHRETVVGRRRDCDLRILSAEVSRRHCLLRITDGCLMVEDLDSVNGTFINGRRVVGKQVVRPGDHLEIGPLEFTVEYEPSPSALQRMSRQAGEAAQAEELEALPLAEEDVAVNPAAGAREERQPQAVPEEGSLVPGEALPQPPARSRAGDREEPLAFLDEKEAAAWHLPETSELRDLLSQIEEPKSGSPRRRR